MLTFLLIQPGATDFDDQGRIKGTLDFPLSDNGVQQVAQMRQSLAETDISVMFSGPCRSAQETAEMIAEPRQVRVRVLDDLKNIDHGLWQGKLIEEIKRGQPNSYRHAKEHAEEVQPPEGESIESARTRIRNVLKKMWKRRRDRVVGLVVSEPLASLIESELQGEVLHDLWQSECDQGVCKVLRIGQEDSSVCQPRTRPA